MDAIGCEIGMRTALVEHDDARQSHAIGDEYARQKGCQATGSNMASCTGHENADIVNSMPSEHWIVSLSAYPSDRCHCPLLSGVHREFIRFVFVRTSLPVSMNMSLPSTVLSCSVRGLPDSNIAHLLQYSVL